MNNSEFILSCKRQILDGDSISTSDVKKLYSLSTEHTSELAQAANEITRQFHGTLVDLEQIDNIKKNACSEDCTFCSQSAFYNTGIDSYRLPLPEEIVSRAQKAKDEGAVSYCLVAAWREPSADDFEQVCEIIQQINDLVGIKVDCSLGFLTSSQAERLVELGIHRYNHNLETCRSKFPDICTTHSYDDRLNTLRIARHAGLQLCTGGIIGMNETDAQRLELAMELGSLAPEEVTLNILVPIPGTPLEINSDLSELDIVRIFAILRFLLPTSIIKISGGRETRISNGGEHLLLSGANGIITSGYLTMGGNSSLKDKEMIEKIGLKV